MAGCTDLSVNFISSTNASRKMANFRTIKNMNLEEVCRITWGDTWWSIKFSFFSQENKRQFNQEWKLANYQKLIRAKRLQDVFKLCQILFSWTIFTKTACFVQCSKFSLTKKNNNNNNNKKQTIRIFTAISKEINH